MQRQLGTSLQGRSLRLGVAPREGYHLHLISILDKVLTAVNSGGGLGCDEMGMNAAKQVLRRRSYQVTATCFASAFCMRWLPSRALVRLELANHVAA